MKFAQLTAALSVTGLLVEGACAAPFRNLGFEEAVKADIPRYESGFASFGNLSSFVPGWQGPDPFAFYNSFPDLADTLSLFDNRNPGLPKFPVVGDFAVGVFTGGVGYELKQTGTIPDDTKTLRFVFAGALPNVSIDGRPLFVERQGLVDSGDPALPELQYYGADVQQFAGREATLSFNFEGSAYFRSHPQILDDISFSSMQLIPEPSSGILILLGSGMLLAILFRAK